MIRSLMAGTALTAVLITGALAQSSAMDTSSSAPMDSSMMSSSAPMDTSSMSSSMMESSAMSSQMSTASSMESSMMSQAPSDVSAPADTTTPTTRTPIDILSGYTRVDSDQLATKIIGAPVYDSGAADANNLGKINDLVLDANGQVAAVVLGVGGFLGIGEKQVAVDYTALRWTVAADNTERWVLQTTKDQLTGAPDFQTVDDQPGNASGAVDSATSSLAVSSSSAAM